MITETNVLLRKQIPNEPNQWLYETVLVDGEEKRNFRPFVYLGKEAEQWAECTEQERLDWQSAWDAAHPAPDPEPSDVPADPANEGKEAEV